MAGLTTDPLQDRLDVVDVLYRYASALDRRDWSLLRTCFVDDVVGRYSARGEVRGYGALEAMCRRALEPLDASQHLIGNPVVSVDGDVATASCYLQAQHVRLGEPGGETYTIGGSYHDELRRTPSGWRITTRRLEYTWATGNPLVLEINRPDRG
jgi:3-phenylpropionate/cinnamic acid dioxygenase small subunit